MLLKQIDVGLSDPSFKEKHPKGFAVQVEAIYRSPEMACD